MTAAIALTSISAPGTPNPATRAAVTSGGAPARASRGAMAPYAAPRSASAAMSTDHCTTSARDAPAASSAILALSTARPDCSAMSLETTAAGGVDAVLAAHVDGRRARGHDGDVAERRARHEPSRLQKGDLHGIDGSRRPVQLLSAVHLSQCPRTCATVSRQRRRTWVDGGNQRSAAVGLGRTVGRAATWSEPSRRESAAGSIAPPTHWPSLIRREGRVDRALTLTRTSPRPRDAPVTRCRHEAPSAHRRSRSRQPVQRPSWASENSPRLILCRGSGLRRTWADGRSAVRSEAVRRAEVGGTTPR